MGGHPRDLRQRARSTAGWILGRTAAPLMVKVADRRGLQRINGPGIRTGRREPASSEPVTMSRFALGCAALSVGRHRRSEATRRSFALLDEAFANGCTTFDTAAAYGGGRSELALGSWMAARRVRDDVVVVGKGGHPDERWMSRLGPDALADDLHASLRRLRVDRIDLYLLHRDDPVLPVGPIMETLHEFVQAGRVGTIGASNWTHTRIEEANQYALARGLTPFTASSPHLSLAEMAAPPWPGCISAAGPAGMAARAWYATTRMPVLAWSPLSGGYLVDDSPSSGPSASPYHGEPNAERRRRLHQLAAELGASPAQVALAYLLGLDLHVVPVVAASTPERLAELLASDRVELAAGDIAWLELRTDGRHDHGEEPA